MSPTVIAVSSEWHLKRSPAFRHLLADPLRPYLDTVFVDQNDFDPARFAECPLVFCQVVPPKTVLDRQVTWIPMWDQVWDYEQAWWNALPETLRIVAFSSAVAERARAAGLPTLHLQYYKDPAALPAVRWDGERVLMYWNRTSLVDEAFLRKLCRVLGVKQLLFRDAADPYFIPSAYQLPSRLGHTEVVKIPAKLSRAAYLSFLNRANLFLAPRPKEGVGMSFLEALARGAMVFATDQPTMNEYIVSRENGYLFPLDEDALLHNRDVVWHWYKTRLGRLGLLRQWKAQITGTWGSLRSLIHLDEQQWQEIGRLELEQVGTNARQKQVSGFAQWQESLPKYAHFLLSTF